MKPLLHTSARTPLRHLGRVSVILVAALALSACNMFSRLSDIGSAPEVSAIANPVLEPDYEPVTMPMPAPQPVMHNPNSLWRTGAKTFFKDTRARDVGDLISVIITIADSATLSNTTTRTRANSDDMSLTGLFGYQDPAMLAKVLPESIFGNTNNVTGTGGGDFDVGVSDNDLGQQFFNTASNLSNVGLGSVTRSDTINLKLAGLVSQVLPNGNMVITASQEVSVNFDVRILQVDGIIRREDITKTNTVNYDQIAEARITYGGEGQLMDVQQPRYGSQIMDVILPF
ncbi:MAG: flagellar basal body L-ring protein FlgH [Alphaproteobacteria bacterium]|nr:flagellar basal body L-ring protein FlgH [Alphaproteobacteria bacterium]